MILVENTFQERLDLNVNVSSVNPIAGQSIATDF